MAKSKRKIRELNREKLYTLIKNSIVKFLNDSELGAIRITVRIKGGLPARFGLICENVGYLSGFGQLNALLNRLIEKSRKLYDSDKSINGFYWVLVLTRGNYNYGQIDEINLSENDKNQI